MLVHSGKQAAKEEDESSKNKRGKGRRSTFNLKMLKKSKKKKREKLYKEGSKYWNFFVEEIGIGENGDDFETAKTGDNEANNKEEEPLASDRQLLNKNTGHNALVTDLLLSIEKNILKKFLQMKITGNSCPMPVEVRRCLKMAKSLLGHGRIFICD